jgi:hypothetical protein
MFLFFNLGNLLVIIAVLATPCGGLPHRSPTHLLIANLAAADLLLGAVVLPLSAARELAGGAWQFGRRLCAVWAAADVLCCTASILSLCGISVDRFVGVTRPLAYSGIITKVSRIKTNSQIQLKFLSRDFFIANKR